MNKGAYIAQDTILLHTIEASHLVEVNISEFGFLDHLPVESSFELHHEKEHLIVRSAGEQDLAGVQLI